MAVRRVQWIQGILACAAFTACCRNDPYLAVKFANPGRATTLQVGDTASLYATATRFSPPICPPVELYNSANSPERFSYSSLDTSVVTVTQGGIVTARSPGATRVLVSGKGESDRIDLQVIASPHTATTADDHWSVDERNVRDSSRAPSRRVSPSSFYHAVHRAMASLPCSQLHARESSTVLSTTFKGGVVPAARVSRAQ
jgi:hypothetical protein